jgi:ribosomal 50S subunit-recycling heat shock protein
LPFALCPMRLDIFLKLSRLCPRRTVAQKLCDAGLVLINGRPAKSAHVVKAGDQLDLRRRDHLLVVRVALVPSPPNVSRADAKRMYEVLRDEHTEPPSD